MVELSDPTNAGPTVLLHLHEVLHALDVDGDVSTLLLGCLLADGVGFVDIVNAANFEIVGAVVSLELGAEGGQHKCEEDDQQFHDDKSIITQRSSLLPLYYKLLIQQKYNRNTIISHFLIPTQSELVTRSLQQMQQRDQRELITPLQPKNKILAVMLANKDIHHNSHLIVIACFAMAMVIFVAVGTYMLVDMSHVTSVNLEYASIDGLPCSVNNNCTVQLALSESMQAPVYFLYKLKGFRQNNRRYVQSKSSVQLEGHSIDSSESRLCKPYITNSDMGVNKSWGNATLDPNAYASPCGTIAFTLFNDTYTLLDSSGNLIPISSTGISWPDDIGTLFQRSGNSADQQWTDPQSQHFAVWMRTSGLPNTVKLWGRIDSDLQAGTYSVNIESNYNVGQWGASKHIELTTVSGIGGKNYLLPVMLIVASGACFLALIMLLIRVREFRKFQPQEQEQL